MKVLIVTCVILLNVCSHKIHAQCGSAPVSAVDSVFTNPAFGNATSPEIDRLRRPYIYLASVSGGVKVFDTNSNNNPIQVGTISKSQLSNLDAINITQDSIWLYVTLGNIWDTTQLAGLAIIEVSDPKSPKVLDVYIHNGLKGGAGAVAIHDGYAYLAANKNGLVILDVHTKTDIQLKGSLLFSNVFPHSAVGSSSLYNARGIAVRGSYAFVCYDRGGLRVVDVSNVQAPVQVSQYCNPSLINFATAYNNIVIYNDLAYVTVDYYGMEVLDVSNPFSVSKLGSWHPDIWASPTNDFNIWASSKGHANEIAYDPICQKVFISAGKSDLVVIDVSDVAHPVTCGNHGTTTDAYGTWGMDFFNNVVGIAYIWSVLAPPYSNYTGFKLIPVGCSVTSIQTEKTNKLVCVPNPVTEFVHVDVNGEKIQTIKLYDSTGKMVFEQFSNNFSIADLPEGVYYVIVTTDHSIVVDNLIKL